MNLSYDFYIVAEPEKVWKVFTDPEAARKIFFGCEVRSAFEPGSPIEFVGPGNDGVETIHIYGEVLEYEPNKRLSYIEHPGAAYYDNHAEITSRITIALEKVGEATKLTLANDEFSDNHPSVQKAADTWPAILSDIKTYVETGKTINFGW